MSFGIHYREFLNLVLLQDFGGFGQAGHLMCRNQIILGHHLCNRTLNVTLETQVSVSDYTYEMAVGVNDRNTSDVVFRHQGESICHRSVAANGDRVIYHTILGTLHNGDLTSLLFDTHILVYHTDTALTRDSYCHRGFGDGVHCGGHKRYLKLDVPGEACGEFNSAWQHLRISGNKEDIVKCESVHYNLVCKKRRSHICNLLVIVRKDSVSMRHDQKNRCFQTEINAD